MSSDSQPYWYPREPKLEPPVMGCSSEGSVNIAISKEHLLKQADGLRR
jgi:hypothetical protein